MNIYRLDSISKYFIQVFIIIHLYLCFYTIEFINLKPKFQIIALLKSLSFKNGSYLVGLTISVYSPQHFIRRL